MRFLLTAFLLPAACVMAAPVALFDGRSLEGWEGNTEVWRVEDGAITGGSMEGNPRNEFLATAKSYRNFILKFEYKLTGTEGFVNGGVQFHSQRITQPPNEMIGYQADIGAKFTGFLYDESRRKKVMAAADAGLVASIEKPGEWNRYEIHAEGDRIRLFVNGTRTVEYVEKDPGIPLEGRIALQIHGDCKAVIAYRNISIDALPDDIVPDQSGILDRFGDGMAEVRRPPAYEGGKFGLLENETVIFTGQTNMAREQKDGNLECALAAGYAEKKPVFRSMAWEADTVYEQWRDLNFGRWEDQLRAVGATTIICQFGQMEALDGPARLPEFTAAYERLLDRFSTITPRLVLMSPSPFEKPAAPHAPDLSARNDDLRLYVQAIRGIAERRGAVFVNVSSFKANKPLTENGVHLSRQGRMGIASIAATQLGVVKRSGDWTLLMAIAEKNRLWADCWRPANWSFVYGDRISQPFGKAGGSAPSLRAAFGSHKELISVKDEAIHALALGKQPAPAPAPPAYDFNAVKPLTPEEQMAKFTLADGYQINLFADERLGVAKPTQFSWDEKGRLYVACSPTYPQTLPGIEPSDYILILEDTDGDGKADKSSRFAEGLTMVQGVEPGDGGLYVCDFDQILHLRDKDGDGRADETTVVLSGFGIGDTHQLANSISRGPDGCYWFTQGLHAFSRVETPYGIERLDKAGVWKFNPRTLKLTPYFNGGTAGHNCWGVAFDDWLQPFHKSGDRPHGYYSLPGLIEFQTPEDYHSVANLFESSPKTTSLDIIGTKALPEDIQGTALIGGYFGSLVELHRLTEDGSGFVSKQLPRLLRSSDTAFRPVDVSVGPDGGIYLADWFNPVIGHYQASYADPRRDRTHGRIWRISSKTLPPVKQPALAEMSAARLLEQLSSPERWTRHQASRLLFDKPDAEVIPAADAFAKELEDGRVMMYLCGIYQAHRTPRPELAARLLSSPEPKVRAYGTRVLGDWHAAIPDAPALLAKSIHDASPRVRLEAIVAATHFDAAVSLPITLQALDGPQDRFISYALKLAVRKLAAEGAPAIATAAHADYLKKVTATQAADHPGKVIYEALCLNCHQPEGKGLPGVYPPLAGSEWVSAEDASRLIKILLHGLTGPITVGGKEYGKSAPVPMPPMGLDDRQTADILSYIRSGFGNKAAAVTPAEVRKVRDATAGRTGFWTAAELE